jgi:hypothetical protein
VLQAPNFTFWIAVNPQLLCDFFFTMWGLTLRAKGDLKMIDGHGRKLFVDLACGITFLKARWQN